MKISEGGRQPESDGKGDWMKGVRMATLMGGGCGVNNEEEEAWLDNTLVMRIGRRER